MAKDFFAYNWSANAEGGLFFFGIGLGADGKAVEKHAGNAVIEITGGEIVAKTLSINSASIGGGTAFTRGFSDSDVDKYEVKLTITDRKFTEADWNKYGETNHYEHWNGYSEDACAVGEYFSITGKATDTSNIHTLIYKTVVSDDGRLYGYCVAHKSSGGIVTSGGPYDGRTADIKISGKPIIRTGSVGGGNTGDNAAVIGSAKVDIKGGDIQAQFILAAGAGEKPTFTMSGGTIRNSDATDMTEYIHVASCGGNGGAVYLEDGDVKISGGAVITNCKANNGGAIYIKRTKGGEAEFELAGGSIIKNTSNEHGGGIYMDGGNVTLSSGKINKNLTVAGNGGGVYIIGGDFKINQNAKVDMRENSAQEELHDTSLVGGYGGALYASSSSEDVNVKVDILGGTIYGNTSDNKGGGICVDMDNFKKSKAEITIGILGGSETMPSITNNSTLMRGGGLYARGENANITINSGKIQENEVAQYVTNKEVSNEKGTVLLNGGDVDHITVTFHDGNDPETTSIQRIVTSTNSVLARPAEPVFLKTSHHFTDYIGDDGEIYKDGQIMNRSTDIDLTANWKRNF